MLVTLGAVSSQQSQAQSPTAHVLISHSLASMKTILLLSTVTQMAIGGDILSQTGIRPKIKLTLFGYILVLAQYFYIYF